MMLAWFPFTLATPSLEYAAPAYTLATIVAQTPPASTPTEVVRPQVVYPLPGALDTLPTFNSNSPELIGTPGILLSTFPPEDRTSPEAHLNFAFNGRFDVFAHHVYKAPTPENLTTMYLGIVVHNPGTESVTVDVLAGASYLSQPDAPFIPLPVRVAFSPDNPVFAGPGSRAMGDILQDRLAEDLPRQLVIGPGESAMLLNKPIPISTLEPPVNGRSTLMRLRSDGPVYLASLAHAANVDANGTESEPTLAQWLDILNIGSLGTPRDRTPTPISEPQTGQIIYGRVGGVSQGTTWVATVTNTDATNADAANTDATNADATNAESPTDTLTIPAAGSAFSYAISSLYGGRLGTGQIQTAPMLVRYPDTAYQAHGNYGIEYDLTFPLYNPTDAPQQVSLLFETPIKEDTLSQGGLRFFDPIPTQTFFRGPIQVSYRDDNGLPRIYNFHVVLRRGQGDVSLAELTLQPGERRRVEVNLLYPPDSTPPQVITIKTQE
jgi:Protein of unknown function (DUF3370)